MIKLTQHDDGKQYLAIDVKDGTMAYDVFHALADSCPSIIGTLRGLNSEEILIEIKDGVQYGFSLSELVEITSGICKAEIYTFSCEWSGNRIRKAYRHQVGG